jgi:hypothetical protein
LPVDQLVRLPVALVVVVLADPDDDQDRRDADPATRRCPWLKRALGARRTVPTMRSIAARSILCGSYARIIRRRWRMSWSSTAREYAP